MTSQQARDWKADRARRVSEMTARLLAQPEPTAAQAKKLAKQSAWVKRNYKAITSAKTFGGW